MKTYRVSVCYEEGFVVKVKATSKEDAEEKAKAICDEYSGVYESMIDAKGIIGKIDTVHREALTLDAKEVMYYYMVYDEIRDGEHEYDESYLGYSSYKLNTETDGDKVALHNWFEAYESNGDIWSDNRIICCTLEEIDKKEFDKRKEFVGTSNNIGEWITDE